MRANAVLFTLTSKADSVSFWTVKAVTALGSAFSMCITHKGASYSTVWRKRSICFGPRWRQRQTVSFSRGVSFQLSKSRE